MKKFCFLIIFLNVLAVCSAAAVNIFADFTFSSLVPADTAYKKLYGDYVFFPEVKAGVRFFNNFYCWGGLGIIEAEGSYTEEGAVKTAVSSQQFISLGMGYEFMVSTRLSVKAEGGIVFISHRGKAYLSDMEVNDDRGNKIGYKFDLGLLYNISSSLYTGLSLGYFHGQNTQDYLRKVSYGGLKTGVSIGFRF